MLIKAGVDISRLRPEIRKKLSALDKIYKRVHEDLVITSTYEGNHSAGSLHYANLAIDFRRPEDERIFVGDELRKMLGNDYDIVFEADHVHVEYDPD